MSKLEESQLSAVTIGVVIEAFILESGQLDIVHLKLLTAKRKRRLDWGRGEGKGLYYCTLSCREERQGTVVALPLADNEGRGNRPMDY